MLILLTCWVLLMACFLALAMASRRREDAELDALLNGGTQVSDLASFRIVPERRNPSQGSLRDAPEAPNLVTT